MSRRCAGPATNGRQDKNRASDARRYERGTPRRSDDVGSHDLSRPRGIGFVIIGFATAAKCYWFGWLTVGAQYADHVGDE